MPITADTVLELADGISILRRDGRFKISTPHRQLHGNHYTLPILDAFSTPKSLSQGMKDLELRIRSTPAWVELIAHIKGLHELGVLVEPGAKALRRCHERRFDSAPVHIRMLNDERRTSSFQSAIRRTVHHDDIVLDIGTGTGVLAVTAALAGARHVYAIEATAMSRIARRLVEANGVADRVTVIEGHSFDVELPEKAQVLVSEIIGDDPLGEQIVPTFADARERLLVKGATVIPLRLQIQALALEVPEERLETLRFTARHVALWNERYGLDFGALVSVSEMQDHLVHVNSYDTRTWKHFGKPVVVGDFDLLRSETQPIERDTTFHTTSDGFISGVLLFFRAELGAGVHLSLHPDEATPSNSWGNVLYLFGQPIPVTAGQQLHLRYHHGNGGSRIELTGQQHGEMATQASSSDPLATE